MHNPKLADKQGLDEITREVIDKLHLLRDLIELSAEKQSEDFTEEDLKEHYKVWYENEKLLQKLWKFEENEDFIKFWNFPGCTCPKMDNNDNYPYGRYVTVQTCPIHGWEK